MDYVNAVPAHRVAQIHIAGHSKYEKYILDTHDHPVIDPVWQLYARAIERCGPTPTLLEWDDHIPSFDEVHAEAKKAERYLQPALKQSAAQCSSRSCRSREMSAHAERPVRGTDDGSGVAPARNGRRGNAAADAKTKTCARPRPTAGR